jgi:hypothetical protein
MSGERIVLACSGCLVGGLLFAAVALLIVGLAVMLLRQLARPKPERPAAAAVVAASGFLVLLGILFSYLAFGFLTWEPG